MEAGFLILLFILGACMGSFLCCQARRLRLKSSKKHKSLGARSVCLDCGYQLKWYDNIPIFSWLWLRGRCRKCHRPIGAAEFVSELGTGLAWLALGGSFIASSATWLLSTPLEWGAFIATLIFTLPLIFLAIYDGLYGELPVKYLTVSIICAVVVLILKEWSTAVTAGLSFNMVLEPLGSALILGGLYLLLYLISKGRWVGDGDWLLALAIGLALGSPWLALIALFLANLLACLYALPTLKKSRKIYFGPFLVAAFIVASALADFFAGLLI